MANRNITENVIELPHNLTYFMRCEICGQELKFILARVEGKEQSPSHNCVTSCVSLNRVRDRAYSLIQGLVYAEGGICETPAPPRREEN